MRAIREKPLIHVRSVKEDRRINGLDRVASRHGLARCGAQTSTVGRASRSDGANERNVARG